MSNQLLSQAVIRLREALLDVKQWRDGTGNAITKPVERKIKETIETLTVFSQETERID